MPNKTDISVATNLQFDLDSNPAGVDVRTPRFSWEIPLAERGTTQTAYRVLVASSEKLLDAERSDCWDSEKHVSESTSVTYNGKPLASSSTFYWKVRYWNESSRQSAWSPVARFTTGLQPTDWRASWITSAYKPGEPLPLFRRTFNVSKPVSAAVLHICGLGQYDAYVNGKKLSAFLSPGWTLYSKTSLYDSYDVTSILKSGDNAIGVMLGNGMYNSEKNKRYTKFTGSFGPPKLIAQLQLTFSDGSGETIVSDATWKALPGPITFSNVFGGEDYDSRRLPVDWNMPDFSDTDWQAASLSSSPAGVSANPYGVLRGHSSASPHLVTFEVLVPTSTHQLSSSIAVYDLGQNASLVPRLSVRGEPGSSIRITPTELLYPDGRPDRRSSAHGAAPAYWQYTLRGQGEESWQPQFFYHGARYLQVERFAAKGSDALPELQNLAGIVVHADVKPVGQFNCSNDLFNRVHDMIRWAQRSNLVSVISDCPHRERLGWLEQYHLHGPSLRYEFDLARLYAKTMQDMADSQTSDGLVPDIAPEYVVFKDGFRDSPEWGSAIALVPWQQYLWTGDALLLSRHYTAIRKYADYLQSKSKNDLLDFGLGDWYDIGPAPPGKAQLTPRGLTATAFYYETTRIVAAAADLLNHTQDAKTYKDRAASIAQAFNAKYLHEDTGTYAAGSQTAQSIPLVMNLVPDSLRAKAIDVLVANVRSHGLTAGDIGHRYLLRALADADRSDVIFQLHTKTDKPGYAWILAKGATALTEAWDARPDSSQNHFMLGHIMEWFYSDLAGISQMPESAGWKHILLKPTPVGDLSFVKAAFHSPRGEIRSEWRKTPNGIAFNFTIPPGSVARLELPLENGTAVDHILESGQPVSENNAIHLIETTPTRCNYQLQSGRYSFAVKK